MCVYNLPLSRLSSSNSSFPSREFSLPSLRLQNMNKTAGGHKVLAAVRLCSCSSSSDLFLFFFRRHFCKTWDFSDAVTFLIDCWKVLWHFYKKERENHQWEIDGDRAERLFERRATISRNDVTMLSSSSARHQRHQRHQLDPLPSQLHIFPDPRTIQYTRLVVSVCKEAVVLFSRVPHSPRTLSHHTDIQFIHSAQKRRSAAALKWHHAS